MDILEHTKGELQDRHASIAAIGSHTSDTGSANSPIEDPNVAERPRLTDKEKKNNHIASEQKRRAAIREGFDRLAALIPGMEGQGRSEALVLNKYVEYAKQKMAENRILIAEIEARGDSVDPEMKEKFT